MQNEKQDKKLLTVCLLVCAFAIGLAGPVCAQGSPVLSFWTYFNDEPAIRAFEEVYGVTVEYRSLSWDEMVVALTLGIATDTLPDVMRVSGSWWHLANSDAFMKLDAYLEMDGIDPDDFLQHELEAIRLNGDLLGLPYAGWAAIPTHAIVFNKDMYREVGLAFPEYDWTWSEYIDQM